MQQRGFTLIELIIVVIILGILAVTAAPRFLDLTDEARTSTMQGIFGAVKSTTQISRASLLLNEGKTVRLEGVTVQYSETDGEKLVPFGYPFAEEICALSGLAEADASASLAAVEAIGNQDGDSIVCSVDANILTIEDEAAPNSEECKVTYAEPTAAGGAPVISLVTSGCAG